MSLILPHDGSPFCTKVGAEPNRPPQEVVEAFYHWYILYLKPPERVLPPDGAYRLSRYVSKGLIARVDRIRKSFKGGGYDPILCAQDVPDRFSVENGRVEKDQATYRITTSFAGHAFNVTLRRISGEWKLDAVTCKAS